MPLDSLDPTSRVELKRIIRTQARAFLSKEDNYQDLSQKLPTVSEDIINALDQLPAEVRQEFLQTWLSSQLSLNPETIMPLLEKLQEADNIPRQKQIIAAAAFLKRQNLPLRQFFLRPLADLTSSPDQASPLSEAISDSFNLSLAELMEQIIPLLQQQNQPAAENFFSSLPEELDQLLEQLFNLSNMTAEDASLDSGGLQPRENQLLSSLLGLKLLNLAEEAGSQGKLRLYLEWPPLPPGKTEEQFILRVSSRQEQPEKQQQQDHQTEIYHLNFIIKLSRLGKIRADVQIYQQDMQIDFTVTNNRAEKLLAEKFPELEERLKNTGYEIQEPAINLAENISESALKTEIMKGKLSLESSGDISSLLDKYQHVDFRA